MYYVGLDVASKSSFVYVIDRKGKKVEGKEIPTDKHGYRSYFKQWKGKAVEVAVEAQAGIQGGYMTNLRKWA